ncbi:hypothetical protein H0H93_014387 [Arthromyces matolae]|nr:hypothetical protein H0H93_014387 [Arthromyces matolae]
MLLTDNSSPRLVSRCDSHFTQDPLFPSISVPLSILPQLEAIGLGPAAAHRISETYMKAARDLHAACEKSLRNAYQKALSSGQCGLRDFQAIYKSMSDGYARQTGVWASNTLAHAHDAIAKARSESDVLQPTKEKKRPVFNHEYTPLLEKYFEYNAYPSAPDRAVLARKSMMTPRQIEVWNHRNRAKKEGKPLKKLSASSVPADLPLKSLEDKMPFFTVPAKERQPNKWKESPYTLPGSENESLTPNLTLSPSNESHHDTLDPPRPSHAFPTHHHGIATLANLVDRLNHA